MNKVRSSLQLLILWLLCFLSCVAAGLGLRLPKASGIGKQEFDLRVLSKLCLLDCTSLPCIAIFLLLAEAERGKTGSGNLTCIWAVRISGI